MGRNRTAPAAGSIVRLPLLLLALLISTEAGRAAAAQPEVITLTPVDIGFGTATLRAEVNPNDFPTEVEFFINDYISPPWSYGNVAAASGTTPTVVKLAVHFPTFQEQSRVFAVALSKAGTSSGYPLAFEVRGVWPFPSQPPPLRPSRALISVREVAERSAVVDVEVNPVDLVYRMTVSVGVEWVVGTRSEQVRLSRTVKYASTPVRLKFLITGLWRGSTYRSIVGRANCFHSETGPLVTGYMEGPPLTTLGEPGHNPPEFEMRGLRVPVGSLRSYSMGFDPFNPEGGTYAISAVSQPSNGSV